MSLASRRRRSGLGTLAVVTLLIAPAASAFGQAAPAAPATLPVKPAGPETAPAAEIDAAAKKVLDRAASLTLGPFAADRSLKAIRMTGRMVMAAQGIDAPLTVVIDDKGRQSMTLEIPGFGVMRSGISGDLGWSFNEMMGPTIMSPEELEQQRSQADLYADLDWGARASKIVHAGEVEITLPDSTKRTCHKLVMTMRGGTEETHFYDVETGLRLQSSMNQIVPGAGSVPITTTYSDYREIKGMTQPFLTTVRVGPQSQEIRLETVEVNPELPATTFDVPDAVKRIAGR
jgi:hypothetical protein